MSESLSAYQFLAAEIIQEVKSPASTSLHYEKLAAMLELVLDNPPFIKNTAPNGDFLTFTINTDIRT
jgi:hypothetical protein